MKRRNKLRKQKQKENPAYDNCLLIEDKIRLQIENIRKLIEERIPTDGRWFANFSECFSPKIPSVYALSAALFVERDGLRTDRAYLGYGLLHPCAYEQVIVYLYNGGKDELLEYLSREQTFQEIVSTFYDMDDSLRKREV